MSNRPTNTANEKNHQDDDDDDDKGQVQLVVVR
jgi:hypothetical protein